MRTKNKREKEDREERVGVLIEGDFDREGVKSRWRSEVKSSEECREESPSPNQLSAVLLTPTPTPPPLRLPAQSTNSLQLLTHTDTSGTDTGSQ